MTTDRNDASATGEHGSLIAEQHDAIRSLLGRLERTRDVDELLPLLESLRETLVEHFACEESEDGLHALVRDVAPRMEPRVRRCLAEHHDFLVQVDRLVTDCRNAAGAIAGIRTDLGEVSARLRSHDQVETDMINEAITRDLGEGG